MVRRVSPGKPGVFLAWPHSDRRVPVAGIDLQQAARMEDHFTDLIGRPVAEKLGLPYFEPEVSRAVVDLNRDPWEWDPELTPRPWPEQAYESSLAKAGLALVPRRSAQREVPVEEVLWRVKSWHVPYHERLNQALAQGGVLLDIHSMPPLATTSLRHEEKSAEGWTDEPCHLVIGTLHGRSASPELVRCVEQAAQDAGLRVQLNRPYAGAYVARRHGQPQAGRHVIQLEFSRSLLVDSQGGYRATEGEKLRAWLAKLVYALQRDLGWNAT